MVCIDYRVIDILKQGISTSFTDINGDLSNFNDGFGEPVICTTNTFERHHLSYVLKTVHHITE